MIDIPVVLIFFNKVDSTKKVFEHIRKVQPQVFYLVSDGPRASKDKEEETVFFLRKWVEDNIDWDCSVKKIYSKENMGCKKRVVSGLNEVFSKEEYAIILEDDCLPKKSFFNYCQKLLKYYKNDERIMLISGNNQVPLKSYEITDDYTFSKNVWIWGWATWARSWHLYDGEITDWDKNKVKKILKQNLLSEFRIKELEKAIERVYRHEIDTWDYQWCYCVWKNNGLAIVPKYNLIDNLGFNIAEALHTTGEMPKYLKEIFFTLDEFTKEIVISETIERNIEFDEKYDEILKKDFINSRNLVFRVIRKIKRIIKGN